MSALEPVDRKPQEDKTTVVFLSFYLLLLAFFILLNSISQHEKERTLAAMGSLEATFRSPKPTSVQLKALDKDVSEPASPSAYQVRLLRVFESDLPLARYAVEKSGNVLRLEVPTESVFGAESSVVKRNMRPVLDGIADALSSAPPKTRRELELLLGSGTQLRPANGSPVLEIDRTGSIAEALLKSGVPSDSLHVGVQRGDPGTVTLTFFSRDLAGAKIDFSDQEQQK